MQYHPCFQKKSCLNWAWWNHMTSVFQMSWRAKVHCQNKCSVLIPGNALIWDTLPNTHNHSHLRLLDLQIYKLQEILHRKVGKTSRIRGSMWEKNVKQLREYPWVFSLDVVLFISRHNLRCIAVYTKASRLVSVILFLILIKVTVVHLLVI